MVKKVAAERNVVALNILSTLSQYAHMVRVELEHKSTMSTAQQVACFLQRLCLLHQLDPKGFKLPYPKNLIASRLGMKPETFSRALADLKHHGIHVKNMQVSFSNPAETYDFVCEHCSISDECPTHKSLSNSGK